MLHEPQLDDNHWTRDDWAARLLARYFIASIGNRRSVKKDQLLALIASKSSGGAGGRGGGVGQDTALQDMDAAAASTAAAKVPIPQSLRRSFNSIYIRATEIVSDVAGFEILFVDEVPGNIGGLKTIVPSPPFTLSHPPPSLLGKANTPHLYILQNKYTYEPYRSANMPLPKDSPLMSILLVVLSLIYVSEKCMSVMDLLEKLEMAFGNLITRGDQVRRTRSGRKMGNGAEAPAHAKVLIPCK